MTAFVDANVIVKAFTQNKDREKCRNVLYEDFVTDSLCLVEAQHAIRAISGDRIHASDSIKSVFRAGCLIIELDRNLLFESFKRTEKYSLNVFDLIHYVAAVLNNCSEFVSYDRDFDNLEIRRVEP